MLDIIEKCNVDEIKKINNHWVIEIEVEIDKQGSTWDDFYEEMKIKMGYSEYELRDLSNEENYQRMISDIRILDKLDEMNKDGISIYINNYYIYANDLVFLYKRYKSLLQFIKFWKIDVKKYLDKYKRTINVNVYLVDDVIYYLPNEDDL